MKKYTALFAALTLVLALAGCGAETQTPMPGQSEQEEFTQNSTENVNETDGMTLLDSVFDTLSEGTDVTITLEQEGVRQSYPNTLDTYWAMRMPTSENFNWCGITKEDYSAASSEGEGKQNRLSLSGSKDGEQWSLTVEDDSNYAVLTYGDEAYYFVGAKEYAYDSDWSAAMALRSFYDTAPLHQRRHAGYLHDPLPCLLTASGGEQRLKLRKQRPPLCQNRHAAALILGNISVFRQRPEGVGQRRAVAAAIVVEHIKAGRILQQIEPR